MDSEFWHERWAENQIGFHQDDINAHLTEFWNKLSLPKQGATVFVPLCGKSADILWLIKEGYKVVGVELSPLAVEQFFEENNLQPSIHKEEEFACWETENLSILVGDFFHLTSEHLRNIDAVYDRASLVALPPEMRSEYVEHLHSLLQDGTQTLLLTLEYHQNEIEGPPFSVHEDEVRALYAGSSQIELLFTQDLLPEKPKFKRAGATKLLEKVYQLKL